MRHWVLPAKKLTHVHATQKADPHACTVDDLTNQMHDFESKHGPRLNLLQVIQSCQPAMALAAEFKRASPSKGPIAVHLDAGEQAVKYAKAGANVISILTEPHWFKGSVQDMREARLATQAVAAATDQTRPAILRKEFVTNTYQILEAAANGADTILLIVAITPSHLLKTLIDYARSIDMEPLVEVHAPQELDVALNAGAKVIGVNNRNLHTFQMDLATTDRTVEKLTQRNLSFFHDYDQDNTARDADNVSYSVCALSGMSNAEDVQRYRRLGVGMVLIGESLMRAQDPAAAIQGLCLHPKKYDEATSTLAGGAYTGGTKIVKVCGITNPEDALVACRSGASFIGVIFVPKSKRCVSIEQGQSIVSTVRAFGERTQSASIITSNNNNDNIVSNLISKTRVLENESRRPLVVGVFQNESSDQIRHVVETVGLDLVQLHGREGMEACSACGVPAIRVVHIEASTDGEDNGKTSQERADAIINSLTGDPVAILLDTSVKGVQGGTGVTFDWDVATNLQNSGLPVLVAGGLNAQNVQKVVTDVRPWGVDVSSGVEGDKVGKKDVDAVDKFVKGARSAALEAQKGF